MNLNYSKIFFDMDDTLVNTRQTILKRIGFAKKKYSITQNSSYIYSILRDSERNEKLYSLIGERGNLFLKEYERYEACIAKT
jgi:hypothetical protein